jgi:hypothetical protein
MNKCYNYHVYRSGTSFILRCFTATKMRKSIWRKNKEHSNRNFHCFPFGIEKIRELFAKFVDWRQCAALMQKEAMTVMPSCSGGCNVVVA